MKRMHPVFALLITAALSTVSSPAQPVLAAFGSGSSAGGWTSNNSFPRRLADVNGDGKADIVGFANDGVYVALSQGNTFAPLSKWIAQYCPTIGGWANDDSFPRMLGDVNGDGKADIVGFGDTAVFVSLSTGAGFTDPSPWINSFTIKSGGWTNNNQNPRLVADVNGDGKADIVGFAYDGAYVSLSSGTSFGAQSKWASSYGPGPAAGTWENNDTYPRWAADVNGDGKADIIGFGVAGVYVSLSSGSAFSAPVLWLSAMGTAPAAGGWQGLVHPRMIADVNGDKKADAIGFANDGVYVALSSGSAFQPLVKWNSGFAVNSGPWPTDDLAPRLVGDFSGNRQADIVGFALDGVYVASSTGSDFKDTGLVPQGVTTAGSASEENFCWKANYTRGVGAIGSGCAAGEEKDPNGLLCYPKCQSGMYGVGPVCWTACPAGFVDIGVSCAKPAPTSDSGYSWKWGDTAFDFDTGPRARCEAVYGAGKCYRSGLIWYPYCKAGFSKVGDLVCSPACPSGMRDDGAFCAKNTTTRGAGTPQQCPAGQQLDAGLCYPTCGPDFDSVGPVCWGKCGGAYPFACGAGCAKDSYSCGAAIGDMTLNTIGAAASLLSMVAGGPGVLGSLKVAAKAGQAAATSAMKSGMRLGSTELIKGATKAQIKAASKTFIKNMVQNQYKKQVFDPEKAKMVFNRNLISNGFTLGKIASLQSLNAASREMGYTKDAGGDLDFSMMAALDPTGISSAVLAFTKYKGCAVDPIVPSLSLMNMGTVATTASKTMTVLVQQETTFTHITTPPHVAGCSVTPVSDCVGKTLRAGQSCSITVNVNAPNAELDSEIRIYTTDFDSIPYPIPVIANVGAATKCGISETADESINLTSVAGAWVWANDLSKKIEVTSAGEVKPVNGWATAGTVTVKDPIARTYEFKFGSGPPMLMTLSEFGEILTGAGVTTSKRPWDKGCQPGQALYAGLCYDTAVGYELTSPGIQGKICPNGWRDDGTSCWPRWTGPAVWGQADMEGGSTMQFPLMVTSASFKSCPPNFSLAAITCTAQPTSKNVVTITGTVPRNIAGQ